MSFLKKLFGGNNKILSHEDFTVEYFKYIEKNKPEAKLISYNDLELEFSIDGTEETFKSFLDNAYSEYKNSPEEIEDIFQKYFSVFLSMLEPEEVEITKDNFFPMIKNHDFLLSNKEINPKFEEDSFYEKLNNELYLFYVIDASNAFRYVQKSDLEEHDIAQGEIKEIAVENLSNLDVEIQKQGENGMYQIIFDGNFEASLILLDIWNKENFEVKGDIVVAIPARDVLIITGSEDKENLQKIKEIAVKIYQTGSHTITDELFVVKDGKFEIFS